MKINKKLYMWFWLFLCCVNTSAISSPRDHEWINLVFLISAGCSCYMFIEGIIDQ